MYQNYLARYARCLATGVWPDYVQNADPQTVVDGWIIDDVTPWDEAVAKNTVDRLEEPIVAPAPEMEESLP